ncbi:hypothetical protein C1645_525622 [Glomus cerebriforme]|uniref:Uncharacterized protein n=1 Tax=Glomus cerebriforme TaxID=658196 RepID=A0A397S6Z9_9GLOM|nr:hypothetical protein C1645_525622 [Glomus cerebriforme]
MNINNYSQNNLTNNDDESNFNEVIKIFDNSDNLSQMNVIQARLSSQNVNDMYTPNVNNAAILDQQSMPNTYYDNIPDNHYQPMSNDASYNNVTISNDDSSYNPYQKPIPNDALYHV